MESIVKCDCDYQDVNIWTSSEKWWEVAEGFGVGEGNDQSEALGDEYSFPGRILGETDPFFKEFDSSPLSMYRKLNICLRFPEEAGNS